MSLGPTEPAGETQAVEEQAGDYPEPRYAWYVLFVLVLVYILAYVDRQVLGLLIEPIKRDLGIGDTQMSLLLGVAFAFFYTTVGLPIARLADRGNRRNLVLVGVATWSLATAFCGAARNYGTLFLARMGVGLGEACLNPAVVPMISDYFPRRKLGLAMGIYALGPAVGGGLAHYVGGLYLPVLVGETLVSVPVLGLVKPWQILFLLLGATGGLMIALLLTVREPVRQGRVRRDAAGRLVNLPLREIGRHLLRHRGGYFTIAMPLVASAFMTFGLGYWIPSFFQRSYGLSAQEAGGYLHDYGLVSMVVGGLSVVGGGVMLDMLARRYVDGHYRALLIGMLLLTPGYGLFALMPGPGLAILMLVPALVGGGILQATGITTLMTVVPTVMRSQIAALYFFIVNIFGAALGPTMIALVTDGVFTRESDLRYSMALWALCVGIIGIITLIFGKSSYKRILIDQ